MTSQCRPYRHVRRFAITNFTHHDHIRILTHNVPQPGCKGQPDLLVHVDLVDAVHLIFHRVFNGDDLFIRLVDAFQRRIQSGGFPATRRPSHKENAVRELRVKLHAGKHMVIKAQPPQIVKIARRTVQQAHHYGFAKQRGQRGNAQIHFAAHGLNLDAAILRQPAFGDIQFRHQLHARNQRRFHFLGWRILFIQHSVDAVPDAKYLVERLNVNIAGPLFHRLGDD